MSTTAELERTVESLLFLSADPVPAPALAEATGAELHEVVTALERLREHYEYERRGFVVRELAGGYTLSSHPDAEPAARRLLAKPRTPPLTAAQAETLAIVAYLQPVSRPEIARIRGVSAESAATTLLERGIIEEAGRSQFGAVLYRTTELFLKLFGLAELGELPEIAGFDPSPEFEQELRERLLRAGEARAGLTGVATAPEDGAAGEADQEPPEGGAAADADQEPPEAGAAADADQEPPEDPGP
ncbi:MAG TPA: SMC-Scp complex subunit ScpB [Solirubrobacteraceae bacterium]|nr:SMC-Scp complex subunit ScpB [Solirubrobacteraceae bacterium]